MKAPLSLKKKLSRLEKAKGTTSLNQESILTQARKEVTETLTTIAPRDPSITTVQTEEDTLVRRDLDPEVGLLKGITEDIDEQNNMYVIFQFSDIFHISLKLIQQHFRLNLNTLFLKIAFFK